MAATIDRPGDAGSPDWDPQRLLDTPLGHELTELARRILGSGPAAAEAVRAALAQPSGSRPEAIARTAIACRSRDGEPVAPASVALAGGPPGSLAEAVTLELEAANAALPDRQREALALRELSRLSYAQISRVMELEVAAVALLLARARLGLRDALRGPYRGTGESCEARERALRILARRLDSEPLDADDDAWIFPHLADCAECERAHAVMLEAAFRYRAWGRR